MPPAFPSFKLLELSDQAAIEAVTRRYPPYSDLEFGSLWSWNVKGEIAWSLAGETLVFRLTDYDTGRPFLTFLGEGRGVTEDLLALSTASGWGATLRLVPEASALTLDPAHFAIEESRDHFDYVYDLERYVTFAGGVLQTRRTYLNGFRRRYPGYVARPLDLGCSRVHAEISALWRVWEDNRGESVPSERAAFTRFMEAQAHFDTIATGVFVGAALAAVDISVLLPDGYGNCLFKKADIRFHGAYAALMHETAKALLARDCTWLNCEQDLGLPGLRAAKLAFAPAGFLRKFSVRRAPSRSA
jgi:hypothetical protein